MGSWKQYLFSLIICSFGFCVFAQIISDPRRKELLHLVSGIVLAILILRPLSGINPGELIRFYLPTDTESVAYVKKGEKTATEARAEYIKTACEAYILETAKKLGADIRVEFSLNKELIPTSAIIRGDVDIGVQNRLQNILMIDLGIPKENQKWI